MHLDVLDLRAFYYRTHLGRLAQRALQEALRRLWPETRGLTVVGYGFAAPMLRPFLADARRVLALMPSPQGVMPWPPGGPNVAALVEETHWPIEAASVDRLIVAHGLETCERPDALLAEIWRVLAPGGRAIFIVPNRSGLWARRDATPFGYGRPYSLGQLEAVLRQPPLRPRAPRRRPLRAADPPPLLVPVVLPLGAHRPPLRPAPGRRRPPRRGLEAGLRPPAPRLEGDDPRPPRRPRRPRRPQARARRRLRPAGATAGRLHRPEPDLNPFAPALFRGNHVLPAPEPHAITAPISPGCGGQGRTTTTLSARGDRARTTEGCRCQAH